MVNTIKKPDDENIKHKTDNRLPATNSPATSPQATIYYCDIGDYLTREEKLQILRDAKSIAGIEWEIITPDAKHNWINHQDNAFDSFLPLGDKKKPDELTVFELYSSGIKTHRDAWCYNFSRKKLESNMIRMIAFYNEQVEAYREQLKYDKDATVDEFIDNDPTKIAWDREIKKELAKFRTFEFEKTGVRYAMYRPFCKTNFYFNRRFNSMIYQMPRIFPERDMENLVICVEGVGGTANFSCIMSDTISDLGIVSPSQCFPFYTYERVEEPKTAGGRVLSDEFLVASEEDVLNSKHETKNSQLSSPQLSQYIRRENISDKMLQKFRTHYSQLSTLNSQLSTLNSQL